MQDENDSSIGSDLSNLNGLSLNDVCMRKLFKYVVVCV